MIERMQFTDHVIKIALLPFGGIADLYFATCSCGWQAWRGEISTRDAQEHGEAHLRSEEDWP